MFIADHKKSQWHQWFFLRGVSQILTVGGRMVVLRSRDKKEKPENNLYWQIFAFKDYQRLQVIVNSFFSLLFTSDHSWGCIAIDAQGTSSAQFSKIKDCLKKTLKQHPLLKKGWAVALRVFYSLSSLVFHWLLLTHCLVFFKYCLVLLQEILRYKYAVHIQTYFLFFVKEVNRKM